jgi:hypothetical protein
MNLYSVEDVKTQTYINPIAFHIDRDAKESFRQILMDENDSPYKKFPEDYRLVRIGQFDEREGKLIPQDKPIPIVFASELMQNSKK